MGYLEIGGHSIYYDQVGAGDTPSLIFLHDGLGSIRAWRGIPSKLADELGMSALVYDRKGYGRSPSKPLFAPGFLNREARSLSRLMDAMGIESAHLVGHSDGASIALLFAAAEPGRTLSVTAEAPHTFVEEETHTSIERLVAQQKEEGLYWLKQHAERAEELFQNWTEVWLSQDHEGWDMRDCLSRIEAPILVVQGDADEFATLSQVTEIERHCRDVESWIIPGCGHIPHLEDPSGFCRKVAHHIRRAEEALSVRHT